MVTIRPEEPEDADAVAAVHVRGWQAGYAGLMPDEVLARLNPAAWAQRRRDVGTADPAQPFRTLVATDERCVVGFVTFGPYRTNQDPDDVDPAYGEILGMYVEPARWGHGVGQALLGAARDGLARPGGRGLRLWVLAGAHRARRFFQRAGLATDGERMIYEVPLSGGRPPVRLEELRYAADSDAG